MKITVKQLKQLIREQVEEMAGNQSKKTLRSPEGDRYWLKVGKQLEPIKSLEELKDLLKNKKDVYIEIAATGDIMKMDVGYSYTMKDGY
jgi:uncharacterized protein (UPF0335 family)